MKNRPIIRAKPKKTMLKLISSKNPEPRPPRRPFKPKLRFEELFTLDNDKTFVKKGRLTRINLGGFVLRFKRQDLTVKESALQTLIHRPAGFVVKEFETELHGSVKSFQLSDKNNYRAEIGYLEQTPDFYKQCVMDLLR